MTMTLALPNRAKYGCAEAVIIARDTLIMAALN